MSACLSICEATRRAEIAEFADRISSEYLSRRQRNGEKSKQNHYFDQIVEIDLETLEPYRCRTTHA